MDFVLVGSASSTSREATICLRTFWVSTIGDAPLTVMVSSRAPTRMSAFTVAVKPDVSSTPSFLTVLKPGRLKVTIYVPGGRSTMLKRPSPSVVDVLTRSMRTELLASTMTPGRTAPDVSLTIPAMPPLVCCANVAAGTVSNQTIAAAIRPTLYAPDMLAPSENQDGNRARSAPTLGMTEEARQKVATKNYATVTLA